MTIGVGKYCKNWMDIGYHKAMKEFGSTGLLIRNMKAFFIRIKKSCKAKGLGLQCRAVEYLSDSHAGKLDIFNKLDTFSYQVEFRIVINHRITNPEGRWRKFTYDCG